LQQLRQNASEVFMETQMQEEVSETSQSSVEVETSPEGNLTMAEFADSLLKKRTTPEEEPEGAEGEEEAAEDTAEESDPEATEVMEQDAEDSAEPPPGTSDVLSKFNVDLDSLSEEESTALAKQLNASAVKRFGKLTAQKKALAAENQALQQQAQQAQQAPQPASAPAFLSENALSGASDEQQLLQEVENLNSLIEWSEEGMENEVQYDDDGNEYVVKDADKTYSKADLKRIRNNARKIIRKDAPARQQWIKERASSDQQAIQTFEFLGDPSSDDYAMFMQVKNSALYKPLVDHLPNSNFALGLMVKGLRSVQAEQAAAGKPKKTKKPTAPAATTEAAPARASGPKGETKARKSLEAAHARFQKSGNMADYTDYLKLKRQVA
jgi:type II secretory pathway pseudopilin PulG